MASEAVFTVRKWSSWNDRDQVIQDFLLEICGIHKQFSAMKKVWHYWLESQACQPMREQLSSYRSLGPDKPEIRTELSSLIKSGIIDPRLCLCEYRPCCLTAFSGGAKCRRWVRLKWFFFWLKHTVKDTSAVLKKSSTVPRMYPVM